MLKEIRKTNSILDFKTKSSSTSSANEIRIYFFIILVKEIT